MPGAQHYAIATWRPATDDFLKSRKLAVKSVLPMPTASGEMPVDARHDLRQERYGKCGDCMQTSRA